MRATPFIYYVRVIITAVALLSVVSAVPGSIFSVSGTGTVRVRDETIRKYGTRKTAFEIDLLEI